MQNPFPSLSGFSFLPHFRPLTTIVRLHFPEWYLFSHLSSFSLSFHTSSSKGFFQLQWQTDQRNGGCIGKGKFFFKLVANCPWKKSNSCPHIWSLLTGFWKTITRRYDLHFFSSRWQLCTFTSVCPYWKAEREKKKTKKNKANQLCMDLKELCSLHFICSLWKRRARPSESLHLGIRLFAAVACSGWLGHLCLFTKVQSPAEVQSIAMLVSDKLAFWSAKYYKTISWHLRPLSSRKS